MSHSPIVICRLVDGIKMIIFHHRLSSSYLLSKLHTTLCTIYIHIRYSDQVPSPGDHLDVWHFSLIQYYSLSLIIDLQAPLCLEITHRVIRSVLCIQFYFRHMASFHCSNFDKTAFQRIFEYFAGNITSTPLEKCLVRAKCRSIERCSVYRQNSI